MHNVHLVVLAAAGTLVIPALASAQPAAASSNTEKVAPKTAGPKTVSSKTESPAAATGSKSAAADSAKPEPEKPKSDKPVAEKAAEPTTDKAVSVEASETEADGTEAVPAAAQTEPSETPPDSPKTTTAAGAPSPAVDAATLAALAETGPRAKAVGEPLPLGPTRVPGGIFAEDWWAHARPIVEIHGNFRTRGEFLYNFSLGRVESPSAAIWGRPSTQRYAIPQGEAIGPQLCQRGETDSTDINVTTGKRSCDSKIQNSANLRLRINPEIHISDNLRIKSQVDLFDNLVLGSTPEGYRFTGGNVLPRGGANELGFYDATQVAPSAGNNGLLDSIAVKRAWAEYTTPLGEIRFGRMPFHWGLGMLYNAGNGHDDDYQTTVDRIQATVGIKPLDLFITGSWDFPNEGAIRYPSTQGLPGYDAGRLDDVSQYTLAIVRQKSPELERMSLSRGDIVVNVGLHAMYKTQLLALDSSGSDNASVPSNGANSNTLPNQYSRRDAYTFTPDLWFQLKYQKFRFELEAAAILGKINNLATSVGSPGGESHTVAQFGAVAQLEQKLIEDRLRLRLDLGYASGDADSYDPNPASVSTLLPGSPQVQVNNRTLSMFRFNPAYRKDLILNRMMFERVQGMYFVRPGVEYDFIRDAEGQRAGGSAQAVWTRASEFIQAPGHDADLGIELNATVYYQSKDGSLNDNPDRMGGFYAALQYGVLFPLAGLSYTSTERKVLSDAGVSVEISAAQMLRLYLGVMF